MNGRLKMTQKHKMMAYVLNNDFGYSMDAIGTLMKVSQSTISRIIKEIKYEITIHNLTNELTNVKQELISLYNIKEPEYITYEE